MSKFITFTDKDCSYMYNAEHILTIQKAKIGDRMFIQFDSGITQNFDFDTTADCCNTFINIMRQLEV